VLRFFADLSVLDVAEVLGIAEGTVKSVTAAAVANLRMTLPLDLEERSDV
jgi:DNA-directed RNA polymerase specialized sigma24 family protein